MTTDRERTRQEDHAWARRALGKSEAQPAQEPRKSFHERVKEWGARCRAEDEAEAARQRSSDAGERRSIAHTRGDLNSPGGAYSIGAQRYAADGTVWRREA